MQKSPTALGKIALGVALVVGAPTACVVGDPLIPESVYEFVADDLRMRTYDLAWQEIRALNHNIDRGFTAGLVDDSLVVIARMHRLETGSPGRLRDRATASTLATLFSQAAARDDRTNTAVLQQAAVELQNSFDDGDFATAKEFGLVVFVLATHLFEPE